MHKVTLIIITECLHCSYQLWNNAGVALAAFKLIMTHFKDLIVARQILGGHFPSCPLAQPPLNYEKVHYKYL